MLRCSPLWVMAGARSSRSFAIAPVARQTASAAKRPADTAAGDQVVELDIFVFPFRVETVGRRGPSCSAHVARFGELTGGAVRAHRCTCAMPSVKTGRV